MTLNRPKQLHRILFIITQGILGGAQVYVRDLSLYLNSQGYDVHVAVGVKGPMMDVLEAQGINVYHIPSLVREISPVLDYRAYQELDCLVKKLKPDLVTTHSSKAGLLGRLVCRKQRIPNVFTAHGWAFTEGVPFLKRRIYLVMERMTAKWADRIICVSDYDRQLAIKHRVDRIDKFVTIHNGVPYIDDCFLACSDKGDVVNIIMVARFSEPKTQEQLLEAINKLDCREKYELQFVGDGERRAEIESRVQQMNLPNVNFLGTRTDVVELLSQAHIFVLASNWEGFPLTVLEAMRAGLPVIASDVGGIHEAVMDGITGYLVKPGDVDGLAKALERLLNNPEMRAEMGRSACQRYSHHFTFKHMAQQTIAIYEEIIRDKQ